MSKVYIVERVFEDTNDKNNRYPKGAIISFDDEERINNLLNNGLIKEFNFDDKQENDETQHLNDEVVLVNEDQKENDKKANKKGDK